MSSFRGILRRIGQFQSALLLTLIYLIFWVPAGLLTRIMADWLRRRAPTGSQWRPRAPRLNDPAHVKEQF